MSNRLNEENRPGYTRLEGSSFNTWWNGGLRTTPYFHNMIGILTEIAGGPTPSEISVVPSKLVPNNATPFPVNPQEWHFRQSIDYSISLNYAVLDYAAGTGKKLLRNIYLMGRNAIRRGNEDSWIFNLAWSDSLGKILKKGRALNQYKAVFQNPSLRAPRGYIISADQPDFPTAVKFVNAMIKSGIKVYRASSGFEAGGKSYPAGSYVVKTNQAFRPYVLDMFEPQHYPNDFKYPGGPPIRPYDAAGWTLALKMGIRFDRILDEFDGPFDQIPYGEIQPFPKEEAKPSAGLNASTPANWGMNATADVVFNNSPVFVIKPGSNNIEPLAWFGQENVLVSGWAWELPYLKDCVAAFVASVGKGRLYAFGPEITFRAQSHGTFEMLFNILYNK